MYWLRLHFTAKLATSLLSAMLNTAAPNLNKFVFFLRAVLRKIFLAMFAPLQGERALEQVRGVA